jgi:hypothetical protein
MFGAVGNSLPVVPALLDKRLCCSLLCHRILLSSGTTSACLPRHRGQASFEEATGEPKRA